jgi:hypothetical protein
MPRDIRDRFKALGRDIDVLEMALTKNDNLDYNLPRNPAKKENSRHDWYVKKNGIDYAVELDAQPPEILREKVKETIEDHCDLDLLWGNKLLDNIKRELWRKRILKFKEVHE